MQVEIGPLPAESARVWLAYAKGVVGGAVKQLPIQVAASFSGYLEEWSEAAAAGEVFRWEGKAEPEEVEYLLHAWFNLAHAIVSAREESGGESVAPEEGQLFYRALVHALLNALRAENRSTAELADHLAPFWPGLE
jgi:hypothetical protein